MSIFIPSNINKFYSEISVMAKNKEFNIEILGYIKSHSIFLLTKNNYYSNNSPNILIAAVFHGEEPAGGWGIIEFLNTVPEELLKKVNISFIPLVNPTGFKKGKRYNDWNQNPNSGFCHTSSGKVEVSKEGILLLNHIDKLTYLAKDGFLSLHEDIDQKYFYMYSFEHSENPGFFSQSLCKAGSEYFDIHPDGILEGATIQNGIIFNYCDGSFEDFLFQKGIPRTACTETPGQLDIHKRINANSNFIKAFINFF